MARINTVGKVYGRLLVLEENGRKALAECSCGNTKWYLRQNLLAGYTQSCGCLRNDRTREACLTHGHKPITGASPTYVSWRAMWSRCTNPKYHSYDRYGGRGISVDPRWKDFAEFLRDMGERPDGHEIDRILNDGNYEKNNCRWSTHRDNSNNKGGLCGQDI